jgi:hypothetical protein
MKLEMHNGSSFQTWKQANSAGCFKNWKAMHFSIQILFSSDEVN